MLPDISPELNGVGLSRSVDCANDVVAVARMIVNIAKIKKFNRFIFELPGISWLCKSVDLEDSKEAENRGSGSIQSKRMPIEMQCQ